MKPLFIVLAVLAFFALLSLLRIRVSLLYREDVAVYLCILCFRFRLYPAKKPRASLSYRQARKLKKQKQKPTPQTTPPKKKPTLTLSEQITLYTRLLKVMWRKFLKHFRIDLSYLHVTVGGEDAAKTAVITGAVSQGVAYLLEFLKLHANFHRRYRADVSVSPDFLHSQSVIDLKIQFSIRLWEAVSLGIRFFKNYLAEKARIKALHRKKEAAHG